MKQSFLQFDEVHSNIQTLQNKNDEIYRIYERTLMNLNLKLHLKKAIATENATLKHHNCTFIPLIIKYKKKHLVAKGYVLQLTIKLMLLKTNE